MSPAQSKMIRARAELVLDHPFFATLALRLELREDPSCPTAWSDGRVLAYNPAYIEAQSLEKVKGMQCHEVLHLACGHHVRRGGREAGLWNRACDYAVNPILLDAGIELPEGYLDDPAHHGRSADAIYADLLRDMEEFRGGGAEGADRDAEPDQDLDAAAGGRSSLGGRDQGASRGDEGEGRRGLRQAHGGDGPAGGPGDNTDPGRSGEIRDAPVRAHGAGSDSGGPDEEDLWRLAVAQAARKAREAGNLPGALERLLAASLEPRLGWRNLLRRFVTRAMRNDFSWVRPNRRYLHAGIYLPGLDSLELEEMAVVVDVSGSIERELLEGFAAEVSAVLEEFDTALTLVTCDISLTSCARLTRQDLPLSLAARGGGGTDFRPPFAMLEREGAAPACLVYFTDLQCAAFPDEPSFPVLWVTDRKPQTPPPFGEVVIMEV